MNRISGPLGFTLLALALALLAIEATIAVWILRTGSSDVSGWAIALALVVGVTFVGSGLVAVVRRPDNHTGLYLLAVGYLWFLGALSDSDSSWLFTIGFAFANIIWAPFTALVLAYPSGQLRTRTERAIPVVTAFALVVPSVLALLVDPTPNEATCDGCPESAIALTDNSTLGTLFTLVEVVAGLVLIALVVTLLVRRWRGATPALRHLLLPVLATGSATLVSVGLLVIADQISEDVTPPFQVLFFVAFASVPLSFLFGILRTRLARSSVTDVVLALQMGVPISQAMADALGDPTLEVTFRRAAGDEWVDADGKRVMEPAASPGRQVTMVERGGEPIAALTHDDSLLNAQDLLDAVAAAAGLSIQNERLQAELRAQVTMLRAVTETTPSLLVHVDRQGRIDGLNAAATNAAGVRDDSEALGREFWDVFIDPDERAAVRERFFDPDIVSTRRDFEDTFTNARGERRVITWQTAPVFAEDGSLESVVAGGIDITVRVRRELELQRERDATTTVLETISSLIAVVDRSFLIRDRSADNPRAAVNRAFRERLGWRDDDLVWRSILDLIAEEDDAPARAALELAATGTASPLVESRFRTEDGGEVTLSWMAAPVADVTGRTDGLLLISANDVTERNLQEAALREHEQEVHASRARIVAAADDARRRLERNLHDGAQQRLVALSVSLRLAESKLASDPEEAAAIVSGARDELSHALDDLRELARGIHPAILTDRGLKPAVEALVARTPVPVDLELPTERLPPAVEAASYYVVAEALTNVVKYAGSCTARVAIARDDGRVVVEVADDGCGGADPLSGSGLRGLEDRVAALDGTLVVESPTGVGTSVRAEIPLASAADADEQT